MCGTKKSAAYFAHDPAHRLLPAASDGDGNDDSEFTCGGCLVAGAGPRYRCAHPGCGFTIHEACARRFPRTLKSAVHPRHRLMRQREAATAAGADGGCGCEVCGEGVKGACYACGVAVHPLWARMPASARGPAHPGGGHEAWLVRVAASPPEPELDGDGKQKQGKQAASTAAGCDACGQPLGAWRYRCVTCAAELHPRCLVPAADQCRGEGDGDGRGAESVARSCCCTTSRAAWPRLAPPSTTVATTMADASSLYSVLAPQQLDQPRKRD
ncbi:unnamed protein product [Miscanthus lutarioriparius]|uniref:Phorbol-ester/DAG-type domain-containing protein n=1 Tax=Miscanthus lutarioriparius TaxID=422564 RepID=A0A811Q635_9POAL|nr:unnamed protein product [Miscanthus lutarioriparius]